MAIAKKATKSDTFLKILAWGEPGSGKTRLALSFPDPLVIDLERGSRLYADQFDFLVAEPTAEITGPALVKMVIDEIVKGEYPTQRTLVIDPITDYTDQLEWAFGKMKTEKGISKDALKGSQRGGYFDEQKEFIRERLDLLLRLPMHVVFVARAKNNWEGTQVSGRRPDTNDIVESLCDIVLHVEKGGIANVKKSRIKELPATVRAATFADIDAALGASPEKTVTAKPSATPATVPTATSAMPDMDAPPITSKQLQQLGIECTRLFGSTDEDQARARKFIGEKVGREIVSRKALTEVEGTMLLKGFGPCPNGKFFAVTAA